MGRYLVVDSCGADINIEICDSFIEAQNFMMNSLRKTHERWLGAELNEEVGLFEYWGYDEMAAWLEDRGVTNYWTIFEL